MLKIMRANESLAKIPVLIHTKPTGNLEWTRKLVRYSAFLALILIPLLGIFRIDLSAGFVVLGRQIWFSDFFIVFGFWLATACVLVMFYSTLGTAFCGWVCPQNTFSAWANRLTQKYLGKRAVVDWDNNDAAKVSAGKNKIRNWAALTAHLLGVSMLIGIVPMLYFYPPSEVWHFVTFQEDPRITGSLYWIYAVFVFIILVDLAVMRYYVCRYTCVYRIWQYLFKTRDALHLTYDQKRSSECAKCNFCVTTCPVGIDPRDTASYDSCTHCGECITACDNLHARRGEGKGLLGFSFGRRLDQQGRALVTNLVSVTQRLSWALPVFVVGVGLFAWGLWSYDSSHLSVYRSEAWHGKNIREYRINIANKMYAPTSYKISIKGLAPQDYVLQQTTLAFDTAGRQDVLLTIRPTLPSGLHNFFVTAESNTGWQSHFRVQHLAEKT